MTLTSFAVALALCILACEAKLNLSTSDQSAFEFQLYASIVVGNYEGAAETCHKYENEKMGDLILNVVHHLLMESKRNAADFVYYFWMRDGKDIINNYFPSQFTAIFNQNDVKLVNRRDYLALKLGDVQDSSNGRTAYGDGKDKTSMNVAWRFIPIWENGLVGHLYFKIFNVHYNQYLKLGDAEDSAGEHKVYGDDKADTFKHQWYIIPTKYNNEALFFVYNREYDKALVLSRDVDESQNRPAMSRSGHVLGNPDLSAWYIIPF